MEGIMEELRKFVDSGEVQNKLFKQKIGYSWMQCSQKRGHWMSGSDPTDSLTPHGDTRDECYYQLHYHVIPYRVLPQNW